MQFNPVRQHTQAAQETYNWSTLKIRQNNRLTQRARAHRQWLCCRRRQSTSWHSLVVVRTFALWPSSPTVPRNRLAFGSDSRHCKSRPGHHHHHRLHCCLFGVEAKPRCSVVNTLQVGPTYIRIHQLQQGLLIGALRFQIRHGLQGCGTKPKRIFEHCHFVTTRLKAKITTYTRIAFISIIRAWTYSSR